MSRHVETVILYEKYHGFGPSSRRDTLHTGQTETPGRYTIISYDIYICIHMYIYMYIYIHICIYTHINHQYSWRVSQFMRQAPPRSTLAPAAVSGFNAMVGGGLSMF
jgi:hypothetical protein